MVARLTLLSGAFRQGLQRIVEPSLAFGLTQELHLINQYLAWGWLLRKLRCHRVSEGF